MGCKTVGLWDWNAAESMNGIVTCHKRAFYIHFGSSHLVVDGMMHYSQR